MRKIMLCRYSYDPLDRLIGTLPLSDTESQRFYCKNLLTTEIQGALAYSIFQDEDRQIAQQQRNGETLKTSLLATDQQRSVLQLLNLDRHRQISYSPYGHRRADNGLLSVLGFNGEREDPATGYYLLGNGHRAFNPVLMRFNSPDILSPFGEGGLNPYTYCSGEPINWTDQTGNVRKFVKTAAKPALSNKIAASGRISKSAPVTKSTSSSASKRTISSKQLSASSQRTQNTRNTGYAYQKKVAEMERAGALNNRISPHTPVTDLAHSKRLFEEQLELNLPFRNGIPQSEGKFTLPNGKDGRSILYTKHFKTSIDYYRNLARDLRAKKQPHGMAHYRLHVTKAKYAEYIIQNIRLAID